jgi:hypothetical protein
MPFHQAGQNYLLLIVFFFDFTQINLFFFANDKMDKNIFSSKQTEDNTDL